MFDFQRNLLTALLAAGLGVVVLAGAVMAVFMGRPDVASIDPLGDTRPEPIRVDAPETGLEAFERYSAILERPVFFSDRTLPVVEVAAEVDEESVVEEEEEEEVSELAAAVAGIVITPEFKLAMVADEQAGKTLVLREGMSLEGEQAAWKLESIEPRRVGFVSVDGRQSTLELKVKTSGLKGGSSGTRERAQAETEPTDEQQAPESGDASAQQVSEEARARAEEIRRRVAERRAQLRAEAERRAQQNEQQRDNDG